MELFPNSGTRCISKLKLQHYKSDKQRLEAHVFT
jgi:hypothetical protein